MATEPTTVTAIDPPIAMATETPSETAALSPLVDLTVDTLSAAELIGRGYDIYGPHNVSSVLPTAILDPVKAGTKTINFGGREVLVPKYVTFTSNSLASFVEDAGLTREGYQNSIAANAMVKAGRGAFSGQMEASFARQFATSNQFSFAYRTLYNEVGQLGLVLNGDFLSQAFLDAVAALPDRAEDSNLDRFVRFFERFGVYYVSTLGLGGSLEYSVAVQNTSSLTAIQAAASITAEYNGLFVSGGVSAGIQATAEWKSYRSNRQVSLRAEGGDAEFLGQLVGASPDDATDSGRAVATTMAYTQWLGSLKTLPAAVFFRLRPVWELAGDKERVLEDAFDLIGRVRRPRLVISASTREVPVILLGDRNLNLPSPPQNFSGFQAVVVDRTSLAVRFNNSYSLPTNRLIGNSFNEIYGKMADDLTRGGFTSNSDNFLLLATFGWTDQAPPSAQFYPILRAAGGGEEVKRWLDTVPGGNSGLSGTAVYVFAGIFNSGPDAGSEAFARTDFNRLSVDLEVFLYRRSSTGRYTLGRGASQVQ